VRDPRRQRPPSESLHPPRVQQVRAVLAQRAGESPHPPRPGRRRVDERVGRDQYSTRPHPPRLRGEPANLAAGRAGAAGGSGRRSDRRGRASHDPALRTGRAGEEQCSAGRTRDKRRRDATASQGERFLSVQRPRPIVRARRRKARQAKRVRRPARPPLLVRVSERYQTVASRPSHRCRVERWSCAWRGLTPRRADTPSGSGDGAVVCRWCDRDPTWLLQLRCRPCCACRSGEHGRGGGAGPARNSPGW